LGRSQSFFRQRSRGGFREVLKHSRVELLAGLVLKGTSMAQGRRIRADGHFSVFVCSDVLRLVFWSKSLLGKELSAERQVPVLYRLVSSIPDDDSKDGRQGISAGLLSNSPRDGWRGHRTFCCGQAARPAGSTHGRNHQALPSPSPLAVGRCKSGWPRKRPASRFLYRLGRFHPDKRNSATPYMYSG
jgi:hypothetical protein